jgi:hypothetical protein
MSDHWTDSLAGARMQVDRQFQHRVEASEFTSQEWGLIMTAVEFDIHDPGDPERAQMYADTEKLGQIIPELQKIQREMGGSPTPVDDGHEGGVFGRLRGMVDSLTSDRDTSSDQERQAKAESLVQDYAAELQTHLEKQGRWEDMRRAARDAKAAESE